MKTLKCAIWALSRYKFHCLAFVFSSYVGVCLCIMTLWPDSLSFYSRVSALISFALSVVFTIVAQFYKRLSSARTIFKAIPTLVEMVKLINPAIDEVVFKNRVEELFNLFLRANSKMKFYGSENRILWVDDNCGNNYYEIEAFESMGIESDLNAENTNDALELLKKNKYAAIISDMRRKEGEFEGYVLLDKVREMGIKTPFFIYTDFSAAKNWETTVRKGGQGITCMPDKLYKMVMDEIDKKRK